MRGKEKRRYTKEDYKKVLILRKKGLSLRKIEKQIGVSSTTVWYWLKTDRKPRSFYAKRKEKKLPPGSRKLSPDLAYIYGVLVGDGHIEKSDKRRTYRVVLNVTDKDFAEKFVLALKKWSKMSPTTSERTVKHDHTTKYGSLIKCVSHYHVVRLASKQVVKFLLSKIKCKTYNWRVPMDVLNTSDEKIICSFLKGFFDSEGCVIFGNPFNRRVEATTVQKEGLKEIRSLLKKIGIISRITQSKEQKMKGLYEVIISGRKNLEAFAEKVNFSIHRKRIVLESLLKSYKRSVYKKNEVEKLIVDYLKDGPKTAMEVSELIERSICTTYYHLKNLKGAGKVKLIKRWRKIGINMSNIWLLRT